MNFQIFQFINQNFPDFNPENEQDLIRAEKILKAESKLNGTFNINEIDIFLGNFKNQQQKFGKIFKIQELKDILEDKIADFEDAEINLENIEQQEIIIFGNEFSQSFRNFLMINFKNENWRNISAFLEIFPEILSVENFNYLKENLQDRNFLISNQLNNYQNIKKFCGDFEFSVDEHYYKLLSDVDSFYFEEDILQITNAIADYKNLTENNKNYLGKILWALYSFDSQNDDTKELLRKNREVGLQWCDTISEEIYSKRIKNLFLDKKNFTRSILFFVLSIFVALGSAILIFKLNKNAGFTYIYSYIILFFILKSGLLKVFDLRKKDDYKTKFLKIAGIFVYLNIIISLVFLVIGLFYYGIAFMIEDYNLDHRNFGIKTIGVVLTSLVGALGAIFLKRKKPKK